MRTMQENEMQIRGGTFYPEFIVNRSILASNNTSHFVAWPQSEIPDKKNNRVHTEGSVLPEIVGTPWHYVDFDCASGGVSCGSARNIKPMCKK